MKHYFLYMVGWLATGTIQPMANYKFLDSPTKKALIIFRAKHNHVTLADHPHSSDNSAMHNALVNCHYFWQIGDYDLASRYWNEYIKLKNQLAQQN